MSDWNRHTVLVTGSTGFVGGWLVQALIEQGAEVVCLVRDPDPQSHLYRSGLVGACTVISGSVEDRAVVERLVVDHEVSVIFHLAAQTIVGSALRNPWECIESNVMGTSSVLEAARRHSDLVGAVVVASSDKAYGAGSVLPYLEEMELRGEHPYDVSKSCADLLCTAYFATYRVPVLVARCGNIFGGGDRNWSRLVPGTIRSLLSGQRPVLRSDGSMRRDYLYVADAVDAYMRLGEAGLAGEHLGQAFNFSEGQPLSVMEMYDRICMACVQDQVPPKILGTARHEILDQYLDSSKAARLLNWSVGTGTDAGLSATVDWYREFGGRP